MRSNEETRPPLAADGATAGGNDEALPEQIGGYRVLGRAGAGAFAVVYVAESLHTKGAGSAPGRRVAIKVLRRGLESALARFEEERAWLAAMQHPGIAQVFDAGVTATGQPYFVMEYLDGLPITQYCSAQTCTVSARVDIFIDVCRTVQHAHQKGIIHCDLKASNVLVVDVDGRPCPKVIDFGIAVAVGEGRTAPTNRNEAPRLVGTTASMSPEQVAATSASAMGNVDLRSDVFALGVILYELLTGHPPFPEERLDVLGYTELVRRIREREAPSLVDGLGMRDGSRSEMQLRRQLAGDLDAIVAKAMQPEASRRYASAGGLADDLERHRSGLPVVARKTSRAYVANRFVHRHRAAFAGLALTILAIVGALGVALWLTSKAEESAAIASRAVQREGFALAAKQRAVRDYERIRDVPLVEDLVREAEDLWPAHPELVPRMDAWFERSRSLLTRAPDHRQALADLRARATSDAQFEDGFLLEVLEGLVKHVDILDGPVGLQENVRARRARALSLEQRSIVDQTSAWSAALTRIAANPAYAGSVALRPQRGLVPLGPDPRSGLEEFALLDSGSLPLRRPGGKLEVANDFALVFVLLPSLTFKMGAQAEDPTAANYDPQANPGEGPVHELRLEPFLISKYEMTQAQWMSVMDSNPSKYHAGRVVGSMTVSTRHPVENMNWHDCMRAVRRLGALLPTEAQWEGAARGGTDTPWWTGNSVASLRGAANLLDSHRRSGLVQRDDLDVGLDDGLEDGFAIPAPVGSLRPNPFGLHDVLGNVWEWCRDGHASYDAAPQGGAAERYAKDGLQRAYRGASYYFTSFEARSASRQAYRPVKHGLALGLRPILDWRVRER